MLLLVVAVVPQHVRKVAGVIVDAARRLLAAGRAFEPRPLAALVVLGIAGTLLAYWTQPVVVIPMGSGRETAFEDGLGAFDARDGVRFRHVGARAALDLGDLGGGTWRASVTAAAPGVPRPLPLVDAGTGVVDALLGPEWSTHEIVARAPWGWRSGLTLAFPGSRRDDLWLREVRIDRGRAWPSLRVVTCVIAAGLLLALALRASGLGGRAAWGGAAVFVVGEAAALAADPAAALPHVPHLVAIVLLGAIVTALARSLLALPPAAVAAGGIGFMAWLAATTAPLYRGGHFVFHSSIAEEIWKGRFLLYYLPYPGSMLSQQAQWGNVIVPHPALYHTLAAPLAALPHAAFFVAEKVLLALLLAGMVWASAAMAARLGPPGAAEAAAILMAAMPASFQLLGLGHLMTILGCWAMTMAVAYVALNWEGLGERHRWWRAVLLLALCYLSYFAGLLFMLMVIAIAAARAHPEPTRVRPRAVDRGCRGGGAGLRGLLRELDLAVPLRVRTAAPARIRRGIGRERGRVARPADPGAGQARLHLRLPSWCPFSASRDSSRPDAASSASSSWPGPPSCPSSPASTSSSTSCSSTTTSRWCRWR